MTTLHCVVVNYGDKQEAFTFPEEENPRLWEHLKTVKAGTTVKLKNVTVNVVAIEGATKGIDVDEVRAHLNAALRDLPELRLTRDSFVAYMSGIPSDHAPIATLAGTPPPVATPSGETGVVPHATSDTTITPKAPQKGPAKTFAQIRAEQAAASREGSTSASSAAEQLKKLFNRR